MIFRFLTFIIVGWIVYRILRFFFRAIFWIGKNETREKMRDYSQKEATEMVQDPVCGVYIPKDQAVHIKVNGKDIFFCSKECKNKYLKWY